jgi:predicted metal-dependent peptidase
VLFFEQLRRDSEHLPEASVALYLTDGYGEFPDESPALSGLWVVAPGGLDSEEFPFGAVVCLA